MKIAKRRRRESKTNYLIRRKLLKSGKPRVTFRKTNRYIIGQYIESKAAQDKVVLNVNSKDLLKLGVPKESAGSLKSISASYLTGVLLGSKIKEKKLETPIVDMGMIKMLDKTKPYAFLKGLKDAGIEIQCDEKHFPEEGRIKGESLKNKMDVEGIKSKIGVK